MSFFIELLRKIWNVIKKFFVKVVNFAKHIKNFFKNTLRLNKLNKDKNTIAVAIKENLENGEYNIVTCLYDKEKEDITDLQTDAMGIEAEELDEETKQHFGNKDMIILN